MTSRHDIDVADAFRTVMRGVASTVTVVTATDSDRRHGMTVTAFSSLSMEPPSLLVCVNKQTLLHDVLGSSNSFCVNVLGDHHAEMSTAFAGAVPPLDRFKMDGWATTPEGMPYLADGLANLFCRKAAVLPYGTHTIFVGEVTQVRTGTDLRADGPLVFRDTRYCRCEPLDTVAV